MKKTSLIRRGIFTFWVIIFAVKVIAQNTGVQTYMNPIQPQDHPDQTLMRVGDCFHQLIFLSIYTPFVSFLKPFGNIQSSFRLFLKCFAFFQTPSTFF